MNKGLLYGIGGIMLAGIGFGIYKVMNKKVEEKAEDVDNIVEEVKEEVKETSTEEYVNDLFEEEKELEEYEEQEKKQSIKDMNPFEDKVTDSKEFAAINAMREAAGKEPLEIPKEFEKFLGIDLNKAEEILNECSAKNKEAIDNIVEGIKKDPKLKKRVLDILSE